MAHKKQDQFRELTGSGGGKGGGGGRVAVEAANTLSSRAIVKVVEVLSEGPIVGISGGAQGIYINNTALANTDGSYNFARASWDYRVGLPSQDYMQGFPSVEAEYATGTAVTTTTPYVRSTSSANVDAQRVTIGLPQGLSVQDTKNGDLNGGSVSFAIDTKLTSSGTWTQYGSVLTIDGKTVSSTEKQYRVDRPSGAGTWDVRVRRITADATLSSVRNNTTVSRVTEVQDIKLSYNDTAYVGIAIDAETVGGSIPSRSYMVKGLILQVPSNYDPVSRTYTGQWDGTFKNAWTDNPAWVLYSLLTNVRFGMGEFIKPAQVDKFSFYDAAVYSDALVPNGKGGTEPRFTFNAVLSERNDAYRWLSMVAGAMRCTMLYYGGLITLLQDRPTAAKMTINKANVIDGLFEYKSTGLFERHTAFNVTFNDRDDRFLQRITTIEDAAGIARYGYNPTDLAALGATTEGQAIRFGKWALDTELNQTEMVTFRMGLNGQVLKLGQVFKLADNDYTATSQGGRVVSVTGTTVALDRPINVTTGSTIDIMLADGQTMESRNIVSANGAFSSITVNTAFSQAVNPQAPWVLTNSVAPRQFKVMGISQVETNIVAIEALYHDPNKYNRVELGISVPAPVFTASVPVVCTAPTSLLFKEASTNYDNTIRRSLQVGWQPPLQGTVKEYNVRYRSNSGVWVMDTVQSASYTIDPVNAGAYNFEVSAVSIQGMPGPAATGTYTIQTAAGGASSLAAPTSLVEQNLGGAAFNTPDLNFKWTNPLSNASVLTATLRDFEVRFIDPSTSTTLSTVYIPPVDAGANQNAALSYAQNLTLSGGVTAKRSIKVEVRCRDTNGNLSSPASTTFVNAAPPVPSNLAFTGALQSVKVTMTLPTDPDFKGILIWGSTTNNFTPSAANLIYDGSDSYIPINALADTTTYYYRVAAYDTFGKALDGAGLNVSAQQSATTTVAPGISGVASLPGSGTEGQVLFNTTDGKLYRYHAGAWTASVPAVDVTGQFGDGSISSLAASKITGSIQDTQIAAIGAAKVTGQMVDAQVAALSAGKITGTIVDSQIGSLAAAKITGQVADTQIAAVAAAKVTGQLVDSQVANVAATKVTGQLVDSQIATVAASKVSGQLTDAQVSALSAAKLTGTIATTQISDDSISTAKLKAGSVQTANLAVGSVVGDKIAANTITAKNLVLFNHDSVDPDPGFYDATFWAPNSGGSWPANVSVQTDSSYPVSRVLLFSPGANVSMLSRTFVVEKNAMYRVKLMLWKNAGTTGPFSIVMHVPGVIYHPLGLSRNGTNSTGYNNDIDWASIPSNQWNTYENVVQAGSVYDYMQHIISGQITAGAVYIGIQITLMSGANLIVDGAITATKVAANAISANNIQGSTITGDKIAGSTITGGNIAGSTITGSNIVGGTITAGHLAADSVNATHIQANAIGVSELAAGAVTADKMAVGTGSNMLRFSTFPIDLTGWYVETNTTGQGFDFLKAGPGVYTFGETAYLAFGSAPNGTLSTIRQGERIPVVGSKFYEASIYINTHRASASVAAVWYDVNGSYISQSDGQPIANWNNSGSSLSAYGRSVVIAQAPANAVYAAFYIISRYDGQANPYTFFTRGFFGEATQYQTTASTWTPSGVTQIDGGQITAATIRATQIAGGSITGDRIAGSTVTGTNIAGSTITGSHIVGGTITAGHLAADSVNATHIQANAIGVSELAAGAVTVDKLVVTSQGQAINNDPHLEDIAHAWTTDYGIAIGYGTTSPGSSGATYFSCIGSRDQKVWSQQTFTIDPSKTYKASAKIYNSGSDSNAYVFLNFYDAAGNGVGGTGWGGAMSGYTYGGVPPNNSQFTECGGQFGANTSRPIPSNVKRVQIGVWLQYSGNGSGGGQQACQDIRLERANDGSLIVDGSITASKILADQVNASHIAAGAVGADELAANSVVAGKIAANSVAAAQIVGGSITGDRIAGSTLTGDKIQGGTITGGNIAGYTISGYNVAANTISADKMSVYSLDAVTARIGTLRTATSGGRMEMSDNQIRIYDDNNVLRCVMGAI